MQSQQGNQLSLSSEDLLDLLLEFDKDSPNLSTGIQALDQDEKTGIEIIRKQLMSCEVQSEQNQQLQHQRIGSINEQHLTDDISTLVDDTSCQNRQHLQQQPTSHNITIRQHQQSLQQHRRPLQLVAQAGPAGISHLQQQQQQHYSPGPDHEQNQHHRQGAQTIEQSVSNDPYSRLEVDYAPVRILNQVSLAQQGHTQQVQQHPGSRQLGSATMMSRDEAQSPSWQQTESRQQSISPFMASIHHHQSPVNPQQRHQNQHHHDILATSPQLHQRLQQSQQQQQHQRTGPSQSVSPPVATTIIPIIESVPSEPSPVVKKNPLLNAQLVNSRVPSSVTPTRFLTGNQIGPSANKSDLKHQSNPCSPFMSSGNISAGTSPVDPSLHPQGIYVQQRPSYSIYNSGLNPPQSSENMRIYGNDSDHQQQQQQHSQSVETVDQFYGTSSLSTGCLLTSPSHNTPSTNPTSHPSPQPLMPMEDNISPRGGHLGQQVKQEIRRKVQQPKLSSHHQTTSLLKQLLSDDNKF